VQEGQGRSLYALEWYQEAGMANWRCLELDNGRVGSHELLAEIYYADGYVHLAREHRRKLVELSGNDFEALALLAVADWITGKLGDCPLARGRIPWT